MRVFALAVSWRQRSRTVPLAIGEVFDFLGNLVASGYEQGAGTLLDGEPLDDGAVSADDEETLDISISRSLLEARLDGLLGGGSDKQNQILLRILVTDFRPVALGFDECPRDCSEMREPS